MKPFWPRENIAMVCRKKMAILQRPLEDTYLLLWLEKLIHIKSFYQISLCTSSPRVIEKYYNYAKAKQNWQTFLNNKK